MPPFTPLSDNDVATQVAALTKGNLIKWTDHAEQRMKERGIDKSQVKECLMKGSFGERPHIPNRFGDVEYKFRMEAVIDSEPIAVVAVLKPEDKVLVITVIDPSN